MGRPQSELLKSPTPPQRAAALPDGERLMDQGERVERMLAEGRRVLIAAIERYRPVVIICAYSGGDDSIVSTHFAMAERTDAVAFNADTLIGLRPTRKHIAGLALKPRPTLYREHADAERN